MKNTASIEPINAAEWVDVIDLICSPSKGLWPGSTRNWQTADVQGSEIFELFRPYPADVIISAVRQIFTTGSRGAPWPSVVLAKTREIAATRYGERVAYEFEGPCPHTNKGVGFDIVTAKVILFCARGKYGGCQWEQQLDFDSIAEYHAHHDALEEKAVAKVGAEPDIY